MPHDALPTPGPRCAPAMSACWSGARRGHRRDADLQALIDAGRGDVPLIHLRFRCSNCGSGLTDFVVTATEATGLPR